MRIMQSRRRFLTGLSLAGAAGLVRHPRLATAEDPAPSDGEPPPETTTIRFAKIAALCVAPQYVAEDLLREEGFTDVRYVPTGPLTSGLLASGDLDFAMEYIPDLLPLMDPGTPLTVLAGVQVGCFELIANDSIQSVTDLKGKSVGVAGIGASDHVFVSNMVAYVGLNPLTDIKWVADPSVNSMKLFIDGKIDAYLGFPPEPQELRARNIGHVVLRSVIDKPWSQYFCCMLTANTNFVHNYPVATKRVVRAIMKATDLCFEQPEWAARRMVEAGFAHRYDFALETLKDLRYDLWREYEPEDTVRYYALRLHELGMITSTPNEIITKFTDWRFLNEVKRELKV